VSNALRVLNPNGSIVLHDQNPRQKARQYHYDHPLTTTHAWNGDVWRAGVALRLQDGLELVVGDFDHGVGVLRRYVSK
jgi:hypothetical protein